MIMNMKQKKIKIEPRMKLNYNKYEYTPKSQRVPELNMDATEYSFL